MNKIGGGATRPMARSHSEQRGLKCADRMGSRWIAIANNQAAMPHTMSINGGQSMVNPTKRDEYAGVSRRAGAVAAHGCVR